jgi:sugar phosphate isomerase/epimerase
LRQILALVDIRERSCKDPQQSCSPRERVDEGLSMDIALQLYTARSLTERDMAGTIDRIAALGYTHLELAGYGNSNPQELRRRLDDAGMQAISAHIPYDRFATEIDVVLEEMAILGCSHAVIPWIGPALRNEAGAIALVANLNEWGARVREAGIRIGYHNHEFEFQPLDGSTLFDQIRDQTDPALVDLELDLCWAAAAGVNVASLIQENAGRVPLLHAKDLSPSGEVATVGQGTLPWGAILAVAQEAGTTCMVVEHDDPDDPIRIAQEGLGYLRQLLDRA